MEEACHDAIGTVVDFYGQWFSDTGLGVFWWVRESEVVVEGRGLGGCGGPGVCSKGCAWWCHFGCGAGYDGYNP